MSKIPKTDQELQAFQMKITRALTKGGFKYFTYVEYDDEIKIEHSNFSAIIKFKRIKK